MFSVPSLPGENWGECLWEFSSRWKPLTASRVFTDLLSNSPKHSPRFSPGYEGMEKMLNFLNLTHFRVNKRFHRHIVYWCYQISIKEKSEISSKAFKGLPETHSAVLPKHGWHINIFFYEWLSAVFPMEIFTKDIYQQNSYSKVAT